MSCRSSEEGSIFDTFCVSRSQFCQFIPMVFPRLWHTLKFEKSTSDSIRSLCHNCNVGPSRPTLISTEGKSVPQGISGSEKRLLKWTGYQRPSPSQCWERCLFSSVVYNDTSLNPSWNFIMLDASRSITRSNMAFFLIPSCIRYDPFYSIY